MRLFETRLFNALLIVIALTCTSAAIADSDDAVNDAGSNDLSEQVSAALRNTGY